MSAGKRLIVAGDRNFTDYHLVADDIWMALESMDVDEIVSGGARGVDSLGERFAKENGFQLTVFPADWKSYGRAAGPIRNKQMAEYADYLLAFVAPGSRGTKNMITVAEKLGLGVMVVYLD
jgi:hypothetical protein